MLHELKPSVPNRVAKRVGRGISAGRGKTAGRGTKGQKSRSGYNLPRKFEGGQTPLILRLPKVRGFKHHRLTTQLVDRALINKYFKDGEVVNPASLSEKGLIKSIELPVKILGSDAITVKVTFEDVKQSRTAE
jgi:large subunit ribosomal protein L15